MKKNVKLVLLLLSIFVFAACSNTDDKEEVSGSEVKQEQTIQEESDKNEEGQEDQDSNTGANEADQSKTQDDKVAIKSLNGPTSIGMAKMISDYTKDSSSIYDFKIETVAQEVVNGLAKGEIDIAAIPANLAATVYNKTQGKVQVAAINTLSVVYLVDNDGSINSIEDLKGRTVYATGQGQTPEYIINQVLEDNNLVAGQDVKFEYKSEASEVASILASQENVVALLPQPFITATQMKNENVRQAIDLNEQWLKHRDSNIVTGVLVVNKEYAENNKDQLDKFLAEYKESIEFAKTNKEESSKMIEEIGVVKAPVAMKALDSLGISYIDGQDMKANLEGYLNVLFEQNPQSIGGQLPKEDFYYSK